MSKLQACGWLLISVLAASTLAQVPPATKTDASATDAERLPEGARLRLGGGGLGVGDNVVGGALSADGKYVAVASQDSLTLFERTSGKRLAQFAGNVPAGAPGTVVFSPTGNVIAYAAQTDITLGEVPSGKQLHQLEVSEENVVRTEGLSFSADGKRVAAGTGSRRTKVKAKALVWEVATGKQLANLQVAQNVSCATDLSPDGTRLLTWGKDKPVTIEDDDPALLVQIWDIATGKELRRLKIDRANSWITGAVFTAGGKEVTVASATKVNAGHSTLFFVFDADSGKELRRFAGRRGLMTLLRASTDGKMLATGNMEGAVQAWNMGDGKRLELSAGPKTRLLSFAFPAPGQVVALGSQGQTIAWWDAITGKASQSAPGHQAAVVGVAFAPDGKTMRSVSADGKVLAWDPASGKLLSELSIVNQDAANMPGATAMRPNSVVISSDGRFAATVGMYADSVRIWDLATGQIGCDLDLSKQSNTVTLSFTPQGHRLAAAMANKTIQLWDAEAGQEIGKVNYDMGGNAMGGAPRISYSPDGTLLAVLISSADPNTGMQESRIQLLNTQTGKEVAALPAMAANLQAPGMANQAPTVSAFSLDSKLLAVPGVNRNVVLARTDSGKEHRRLEASGGFGSVTAMVFSPDGRTLAIAHGGDRTIGPDGEMMPATAPRIDLFELASGRARAEFKGHIGGVNCLAFSPDGLALASGGTDTTVILWDPAGVHGPRTQPLSAAELSAEWAKLAKPDAPPAFAAHRRLVQSPAETVAFIGKQLGAAKPSGIDDKQISTWVTNLDSENFATRDEAFRSLEKLANQAEPALRKARAGNISLEMRRRVDDLIEKIERGNLTNEELQAARAVEILERIATPAARDLLAALAKGAPPAVLTREAQAALGRLKR
jgi:WD40 repeat protein